MVVSPGVLLVNHHNGLQLLAPPESGVKFVLAQTDLVSLNVKVKVLQD